MSIFSPPRLHTTTHNQERKVTWLELFYDLVYVATLIQLGNALSEDVSLAGFLRFVILFAPIWWAWTGITFYMNRFIVDDLWHRLLIYLQIVVIFTLGISLDGAFGNLTTQFAFSYAAIRLVQVILYVRTWKHAPATRPLTRRYVASYIAGISLWLISAFLPIPYATLLWLLALVIEIGVAVSPGTRKLVSLLPPDSEHMRERYGIFVIIVMGESFIKTITYAAGTPLNLQMIGFSLISIFVVFAVWWLYFSDIEDSEIKSKAFAPFAWVYAHLPLTIGITAFGVGTKKLFQSLNESHLKSDYIILYCTSLILYILAISLIEAATQNSHYEKTNRWRPLLRLGLAAVLGMLMFAGQGLSPTFLSAIVAALFLCVIAFDVGAKRSDQAHLET